MDRRRFVRTLAAAAAAGGGAMLTAACGPIEAVQADGENNEVVGRQLLGQVLAARRSAEIFHHLGPSLRPFAGNARLVQGRTMEGDSYDMEWGYDQWLDVLVQRFHQPPPAGLMLIARDPEIQVLGSRATVGATLELIGPRGGWKQQERYQFLRSDAGWLAFAARWVPLEETEDGLTVRLSAFEWRRRDARAHEARDLADPAQEIEALRHARRWAEAHATATRWTRDLTPTIPAARAAVAWSLRGATAVECGEVRDALPSFRKAVALDPKVVVPPYKAAADARAGV